MRFSLSANFIIVTRCPSYLQRAGFISYLNTACGAVKCALPGIESRRPFVNASLHARMRAIVTLTSPWCTGVLRM